MEVKKLIDRGLALTKKEKYLEAEKCFAEAIGLDPNHTEAWVFLSFCLINRKQYDDAIKCCDKAIKINIKDNRIWNNKAVALYKLGRYEEAIEYYDKAIEHNSMDMNVWEHKCHAFRKLGQYKDAAQCARDALITLKSAEHERHAHMIQKTEFPIEINLDLIRWEGKFKKLEEYFLNKMSDKKNIKAKMSNRKGVEIKLEVIKGPEQGKVFVLNEPTTCVAGRSREARFRFGEDDPYISRRHFLLEVAPPKVYFRDLDVTNPSKINDLYVDEAELADGNIIEVGYTHLKVSLKMEVQTEVLHCKECGKTFEIYGDEGPAQVCTNCLQDLQKEQQRQESVKDKGPLKIQCQCGKDLTKRANSDGRARELAGKVTYTCEKCLSKMREARGRKIDGYETIKMLGKGGMGQVYLAYHKPTARLVALKEMNIFNPQLAARFSREIRIMKKVAHDNVLCYVDNGQEKKSGKPYLVMEYAAKGCLDNLLEGSGSLKTRDAVQLIIQSLNGLEYVHNAGIVHRDIKPENILLKGNGRGTLIPKIADFGLAREFSKAGGSVLTQLGTALGTILYMPPEQIRDAHNVRETADLYSMGVTLYYLLTGKYPFNYPTPLEVLQFINEHKNKVKSPDEAYRMMMEVKKLKTPHLIVLSEEPIPIKERVPQLSFELAQIVDKSIKKDVKKRYQTGADFNRELERVVGRL